MTRSAMLRGGRHARQWRHCKRQVRREFGAAAMRSGCTCAVFIIVLPIYDYIHHSTHHFPMRNPVAKYLKHYPQAPLLREGAASASARRCDRIFRTDPPELSTPVPQFYFIPKRLARKAPRLARGVQVAGAMGFRFIFWLMRLLPLERASWPGSPSAWWDPITTRPQGQDQPWPLPFPIPARPGASDHAAGSSALGYSAAELIKLEQIWEERDERIDFVVHPRARELMQARRPAISCRPTSDLAGRAAGHQVLRADHQYDIRPRVQPCGCGTHAGAAPVPGEKLVSSEDGLRPLIRNSRQETASIWRWTPSGQRQTGALFAAMPSPHQCRRPGLCGTGAALVVARAGACRQDAIASRSTTLTSPDPRRRRKSRPWR